MKLLNYNSIYMNTSDYLWTDRLIGNNKLANSIKGSALTLVSSILALSATSSAHAGEISWSAWIDSGYIVWNGSQLSDNVWFQWSVNYDFGNWLYLWAWWRKDTKAAAEWWCDEIDYIAWYKTKYKDISMKFQASIYDICDSKVTLTEADVINLQSHFKIWDVQLSWFYSHFTADNKEDGLSGQWMYHVNDNFSVWARWGLKEWNWKGYFSLRSVVSRQISDDAKLTVQPFLELVKKDEKWVWIVANIKRTF